MTSYYIQDNQSDDNSIYQEADHQLNKFRGIMICNQPQRWQYSIEQIGNIPLIRNDLKQEENPLFLEQEKNLQKTFKKMRVKSKHQIRSQSTTLNVRYGEYLSTIPTSVERNTSIVSRRSFSKDFDSIQYQKSEKDSSRININQQRYYQQNILKDDAIKSYRCDSESKVYSLKEKFDNYNRVIALRNRSQLKQDLVLPKIFDKNSKQIQNNNDNYQSINLSNASNKYYPDNLFKNNSRKISKVMIEQQEIMQKMILQKLKDDDLLDKQQIYQEVQDIEMLSSKDYQGLSKLNSHSPIRQKKYRVKKIQSPEKFHRELSPQEKTKQDIKKLLNNKSNLTNLYYEFMNSLKFVK